MSIAASWHWPPYSDSFAFSGESQYTSLGSFQSSMNQAPPMTTNSYEQSMQVWVIKLMNVTNRQDIDCLHN